MTASRRNEAEFIKAENDKINATFRAQLRKVDRTGEIGRKAAETLWFNGLIQFGRPRPEISNPYNCYRLTDKGREFIGA